jgi:hypothetical protein
MKVIPQKDRPVGLLLFNESLPIPIPIPFLFYPRPEDLEYTHPSRGNVIQTFDGGWVDDFGEGLTDILATGTTGWNGGLLPGELKFYVLRDLVILQFHQQRANNAKLGRPIENVHLYWVDTLNMLVYDVYPISFTAKKNRQRPLLYQYSLRMTGIKRLASMTGILGGLGSLQRMSESG